jgi:hypothetical protein
VNKAEKKLYALGYRPLLEMVPFVGVLPGLRVDDVYEVVGLSGSFWVRRKDQSVR